MTDLAQSSRDALAIRAEVETLLYREAALLDSWELDEWLTLFTPDCRYVVPSTDLPEADADADVVLIDDDFSRLAARVQRLKSRFAHREYPWSRTRHLVTNVQVLRAEAGGDAAPVTEELMVTANFAVYRFRGNVAVYVGRYDYVLVRTADGLKIRYRRASLDNEHLDEHGAVSIVV